MVMTGQLKGGLAGTSGWVRMLCVLSLVLVAFAHKPLDVSHQLEAYAGVDFTAYILPDGTLPDLCLTGEGEDSHHAGNSHCEACRIASSVDLPLPFSGLEITDISQGAKPTFRQGVRISRLMLRPGASPRGPPSSPYV